MSVHELKQMCKRTGHCDYITALGESLGSEVAHCQDSPDPQTYLHPSHDPLLVIYACTTASLLAVVQQPNEQQPGSIFLL